MLHLCPEQGTENGKAQVLCLETKRMGDMALPGAFSTLNTSESPNNAVESGLSAVLEAGEVPRKYYLSPAACAGILRRAAKRGRELPPRLKAALERIAWPTDKDSRIKEVSVSPQINSKAGTGGGNLPLVMAWKQRPEGDMIMSDKAYNISTTSNASAGNTGKIFVSEEIRRLTPGECEKLQGFSGIHTRIPGRNKPADQCPDSPRYKAMGNSWPVPVARWIGERISEHNRTSAKGV
jgi:site-specific DNA-cytosine methylase